VRKREEKKVAKIRLKKGDGNVWKLIYATGLKKIKNVIATFYLTIFFIATAILQKL